ncbi:uncharacterized protein LOC116294287 [Actinia tenebrosa]|uniref:Uncharacterized protein LOC116294287 n=1 Tax=Actinia tenebrosa TaxID=6105 RepID=A0A6P8HMW5_ACTTE|nr:uncharacterized protein LOC116294287 [Actinia tenebrosa]
MITIDPGPMRRRRAADSIVLGDTLSIQYQSSQTQSLLFECEEAEEFSSARGYLITHIGELTYCSPCPYGTFKENGTCSPCPAGGFYQDEQAQYQIVSHGLGCKQCPLGAFVSPQTSPGRQSSDCQACPDGTRRDRHALFKACSCLEDHYRIDRFKKCFPCPRGYMCTNETINLLPGFFWQWNSTEAKLTYTKFSTELQVPKRTYNKNATTFALGIPKAYACPVSDACKGGLESECTVGYEGPLCAVCSRQFYMLASICRRCPTLPWIIAQVTLAILVLVGLFAFLFKDKKEKRDGRSLSDIMTSRLKILVGFYQVTSGTISSFSYVEWPATMVKLVRYAEIFQMNLLQIAPLHCIAESLKSDAHVKLLAIVVFNTLAILAGLVYYHIMKRRKTRQNDNNSIPGKILLQQRCYRMVFLALFITYPMTCSYIFQVLPDACHKICTSTNEKFCQFYLKSDYSVACGGERFEAMGILSYTLLVYPVGFPSLIFFLLWKYYYRYEKGKNQNEQIQARTKIVNQNERKNLNHDGIVQGLKFIYENYASNVWFWEIIELVRKVIITSVILLAHAESRTYLGITAIISGLYAVLFAYYKPITDTFEHWLQLTSLLATMVNMIVGMLLKIPSDSLSSSVNTQVDEVFVTVLLMIANIVVIAIMVVRYMVTFLQTLNSIRKNPHCSLSCCLYLLLTVSEAGNDISGIDNNDDLKTYQDMNTGDEQPELEMTPVGLSVELKEDDENGKKL